MAFYSRPSDLLGTLEAFAVLFLLLSVYSFCELFPDGTHDAAAFRRIIAACVMSACLLPLTFSPSFIHNRRVVDTMVRWEAGPYFALFGLWAILIVLGGFARLFTKYLRLKDSVARLHIRLFLAAGLSTLTIGIAASYVLPLLGHTPIFFLGPDASMASMVIFTFRVMEGFRSEGYRLFLPLIYRNEFCGFIGLGQKLDGAPYFSADLQVLNALRLYLALTLRNQGYYEELQQLRQRAEEDVARLTEVITSREVVRHCASARRTSR